jgi:pimeloyl-ACP methyl ester carboxylesterase
LERADLGDVRLDYDVLGEGEPVLFIHGSFIAETFRPICDEPALARVYRLIIYHRRGYVGSTHLTQILSVPEQAADCRALLRHLGINRAHVVGHSFGGVVALQLALDAPELVGTLALLEPALAVGASGPGYRQALANSSQRYRDAGAAVALDETLRARWPEYGGPLEKQLPGAFDQAMADAPDVFEWELPGLLDWDFDQETAERITQPVLSVLGSQSEALWSRFGETHRALCAWLPKAEAYILPGAHHFLQVENPYDMAQAIASFFRKHPLNN